jgi:hypothetical protein
VVSTVAGVAKSAGWTDGTNGTATVGQFNSPQGVAVDDRTRIYVADSNNHTIRRISPAGVVTTLGGLPGLAGSADGAGSVVRFNNPQGITVKDGALYVADFHNNTIRRGIITQPVIDCKGAAFNKGHFEFSLSGLLGQPVVVQGTTNLSDWVPLWTNNFGTEALSFSDAQTNPLPRRLYRAVIP